MGGDWTAVPLGELVEPHRGISYGIVQPGKPVRDGVPIVRVSDVRNGRIDVRSPLCVSPEIEHPYGRTRLRGGELLITIVGTVGETAIVPENLAGWNVARAIAVLPVRPEIGAYWVRLALRACETASVIQSRLNTTVQATLNLSDLARLPIVLPPRFERDAIAHILRTLDDKIEMNRRMSATLEAMTRALFKSWFVDFDPVRAKIEGRDPGLPPQIAALFPDSLAETEHGEIPEGWEQTSLADIAEFLNGLALQKYPAIDPTDSLPVIKIAELRNGVTAKSDRASRNVPAKYVVNDGDFLFSWSGSLLAKFWTEGEGALNQHLFKVTSDRYPAWFFSEWVHVHLEEFQRIAAFKATTMGHIQRSHLQAAVTNCPPDNVIASLGGVIEPMVERRIRRELDTRALAALRDALLPKLISGALRVKDPETFLDRVP